MFVSGTPVFTDSGWKNIEDISGRDKVLVRNFLGDAEFIQPFALKRRQYDGEVVTIGAKDWSFTVTPDHLVLYDQDINANEKKFRSTSAGEMQPKPHYRITRKFRYMFSDVPAKEIILIRDDLGKRYVTISDYDWYKLVAYALCRGFVRRKPGRPMLFFLLDEDRIQEQIVILGDILDRIGVSWHVQYSEKTRPKLVVSSRNTLAHRIMKRLGGSTRKTMYLPDKIIYNSSKELTKLLIDTIIDIRGKQIVTTNKKFIDSLSLLGTLGGYSFNHSLLKTAGSFDKRPSKKDSYILTVYDQTDTYSPKKVEKKTYSGYIYGIDLFEGQIYVKEGSKPVWTHPK